MRAIRVFCWNLLFAGALGVLSPTEAAEAPTPPSVQNAAAAALPPDLEKALQLPKGTDQNKALSAAAADWAKKDPGAALGWLKTMPRGTALEIYSAVVSACALNNPKLAAEWMVQNNKAPDFWQLHGLMYVWSWKGDTASAVEWCMQAPKDARDIAFFSVGDGWYLKNQPAACEWATKLESDDDRHSAVRGIALKWGPAAAVWVKTLKPDNLKIAAKTILGNRKFIKDGVRDEAAMKEWLEQLPLSAEEKEDLLKPPAAKK